MEKKKYQCTKCRYYFYRYENKTGKSCPYCGEIGTIIEAKSAAEWLDEI